MDETILTRGTLPETTGIDRVGELILGGVPLGEGRLFKPGLFLLTVPGGAFPVEGRPAAWWPDGSIKWLRLCGLVDLKGGQANPFVLAEGPAARQDGLGINHLPGIEEITTPAMVVRVSPDPHRVLDVRGRDGRAWTKGPGLSAVLRPARPGGDPRGAIRWGFEPPGLRVVTADASRVVLRLAGRFVEDGRTLAELVTFIEVLRDEPRLGIQPVLIYLGDSDRDAIAALDLAVHGDFGGENARFGFGQDRGPGYWDDCRWLANAHRWPQARLVQSGSCFYRLDKRTGQDSPWVKVLEGRRAQGWCHLGGPAGGMTGAMRYFWQEYPRALTVDADAGTLTFGLVPSACEALDLRRYSPVLLGSTIYEAGEGAFPAQSHGACGIAKASELMIRFHAAGYPEPMAAAAGRSWTVPARLLPDPEAFAASRVAGVLAARPPAAFEADEARQAARVDFLMAEAESRGWYGLTDFGDVMQTYYSDRGQWAFDDGGYGWVNAEGLPDLGLWLMALRHGRPDWLEGAIAMTRHNRDVDMYHAGGLKGLGSRHNVNHWGCKDKEWRVSMPLVKRFHYYLTADPWTAEVMLDTIAVYQSCDRTCGTAPSMVSALAGLMVKAELTGDQEDRDILLRIMDVFAQAVRPDGHFVRQLHVNLATGEGEPVAGNTAQRPSPTDSSDTLMGSYFLLQNFGGQHVLVELAETYEHDALIRALVRHADLYLQTFDMRRWQPFQVPSQHTALPFLALAYRHTGERRFRQAIEAQLRSDGSEPRLVEEGGDGPADPPRRTVLSGQCRPNKIVCTLGIQWHQRPYGHAVCS